MTLSPRLAVTQELHSLAVDYWYDVDFNWGRTAHEYFTEDGVFDGGDRVFEGQEAIRAFYKWREGRGERTARHLVSNMRVTLVDDTHAETVWVMSLYAADGPPPLPSEPAIMMADVSETCVRGNDGRWRYRKRTVRAAFKGVTPTTVPPQDLTARK